MIDWNKVEREYVYGILQDNGKVHFPTLKELAVKYGIKLNTVLSRAHRYEWNRKREVARAKAMAKAARMTATSTENPDEDLALNTARLGMQVCNEILAQMQTEGVQPKQASQLRTVSEALKNFLSVLMEVRSIVQEQVSAEEAVYEVRLEGLNEGADNKVRAASAAEGSDGASGEVQDTGVRQALGQDDSERDSNPDLGVGK